MEASLQPIGKHTVPKLHPFPVPGGSHVLTYSVTAECLGIKLSGPRHGMSGHQAVGLLMPSIPVEAEI